MSADVLMQTFLDVCCQEHVQPQRDMWAFDTVTLRYVLDGNSMRTFCHTSLWALDTVTLGYVLDCSLVRAFCHEDFVGLVCGRNACLQISPRECIFATLDPSVNEKCERTTRASDQMMVRCTDADAVSYAVHALGV